MKPHLPLSLVSRKLFGHMDTTPKIERGRRSKFEWKESEKFRLTMDFQKKTDVKGHQFLSKIRATKKKSVRAEFKKSWGAKVRRAREGMKSGVKVIIDLKFISTPLPSHTACRFLRAYFC